MPIKKVKAYALVSSRGAIDLQSIYRRRKTTESEQFMFDEKLGMEVKTIEITYKV